MITCDFAEYYHIYDIRQYKPLYIATLAVGLRAESRTMTEMSGAKAPPMLLLTALQTDMLSLLWWSKTEDGQHNRNRPKSLLDTITKPKKKLKGFRTPEDFEAAWAEIEERNKCQN